jgi:hypothetical protein
VGSFTPRPLYPRGKCPWYPLDRRLGGHQSQSGRRGEKKILDPTVPVLSRGLALRTPEASLFSPTSFSPLFVFLQLGASKLQLGLLTIFNLKYREEK